MHAKLPRYSQDSAPYRDQAAQVWRAQGGVGVRRAWLRCPWAAAGPGPDKFRMQFPHDMNQRALKNRRISTIRLQYLKYTQGNCMRNYRGAVRTRAIPRPGRAGVEGVGGPGCGACGRRGMVQTSFAHNFQRSFFETAQKRCNSNEMISMFEQVVRELRAKLMGERPVGPQAARPAHQTARPNEAGNAAPGTPMGTT